MPYERHQVVVVTVCGTESRNALIEFRKTMPEEVQRLFVGPVDGINAYSSFALMPDGGSAGRDFSRLFDGWRERLLAFLPRLLCDWVHVHLSEEEGYILDADGEVQPFKPYIVSYGATQDTDL